MRCEGPVLLPAIWELPAQRLKWGKGPIYSQVREEIQLVWGDTWWTSKKKRTETKAIEMFHSNWKRLYKRVLAPAVRGSSEIGTQGAGTAGLQLLSMVQWEAASIFEALEYRISTSDQFFCLALQSRAERLGAYRISLRLWSFSKPPVSRQLQGPGLFICLAHSHLRVWRVSIWIPFCRGSQAHI